MYVCVYMYIAINQPVDMNIALTQTSPENYP